MPGLGNQLAQTAHQLMALVIDEVFVIKLFEAGVHFTHFMDQRTAGDLGRMGGKNQLQGERFHGFFDGGFIEVGLLFQFTQRAGNHFRVAGCFAFWRNAMVLLGGVGQVQKLAKRAGNRQQLVVRQVLQRSKQLLAIDFIASAG